MALGIPMALLISAGIGAAGGIAGGLMGSGGDEYSDPWGSALYAQLPDYPEATGAREDWWKRLQQWGQEPGYGALPMNWEDIKKSATDKLSRFYWGGVTDPGLAGKMKSQAARLNRPVNEAMIGALGQQEKIDLFDLVTQLRKEEVGYGEEGRKTWLSSMMNLAGLKPSYVTRTGVAQGGTTYGAGNMIGDVSSGISSLFSQYASQKSTEDLLTKLFNQSGGMGGTMPITSQSSLTGDWEDTILNNPDLIKQFPGLLGKY